jgi:hypothetical protein
MKNQRQKTKILTSGASRIFFSYIIIFPEKKRELNPKSTQPCKKSWLFIYLFIF